MFQHRTIQKRLVLVLLLLLLIFTSVAQAQQAGAPFRVYLGFEDGPTRSYTPEILDILAQYGAKATFLIAGKQIAGHEDLLNREVREGHAILNHLWEEPDVYAGQTDALVVESYLRTEDAIRAALEPDARAIYDAQPKLFWQPGGGRAPFPAVEGLSVITYNWHVNSDDCGWGLPADVDVDTLEFDQAVIDNVLNTPVSNGQMFNAYDYGDGVVIIFHDLNRVTGRVLPTILAELQAAGATFERLPRPWDQPNTMPVQLGVPPQMGAGIAGFSARAQVLEEWVNVRSAPATSASIVTTLAPQGTITAVGRSDISVPGWIQVQAEGVTGWVYRPLIKVFGAIPNLPHVESSP